MEREMTLRQFCKQAKIDPSNWSKIERGLMDAPKSQEVLRSIADTLQLSEEDVSTLRDLAMFEAIPDHLKPEEKILEKLPVFFRTVRGDKPTKEELEKLIELLTK